MMDYSDRHCRYLWRLLSKQAWLYTEMVTTGALLHGPRERFLAHSEREHPVALQLGGSDPGELAECAKIAEQAGFDEVNLNCGCPSDRVQNNQIGAVLMKNPSRVAECLASMQAAVSIPVTVKHRIGVDDMTEADALFEFVRQQLQAGCTTFIVHARKAWLKGLSPKENREVPPLNYDLVYELKEAMPELEIILNGGLKTLGECQAALQRVDGVMVGREAYHRASMVAQVDKVIYDQPGIVDLHQVYGAYVDYCHEQQRKGISLGQTSRHALGLFHGVKGARLYRRHISEHVHKSGATIDILWQAYDYVKDHIAA